MARPAPDYTTAYWARLPGTYSTHVHVTYDQRHTLCGRGIPALRFDGSDGVEILQGSELTVGVTVCRDCYR
jgi:hypothetical protein